MENTEKRIKEEEKRKLPESVMLRVRACALLFLASTRAQKIAEIAESKGIDLESASVMYTIGALKRAKRQGTARNYEDALDKLEAEQAGDRGCRITKTIGAEKTSRKVARINRINAGKRFSVDGIHYIHDYNNIINVDGKTEVIPHYTVAVDDDAPTTEPKPVKVLGTLYVQWEERQDQIDPANLFNDAARANVSQIRKNLDLFFKDYTARLSKMAKKRLYEIVKSDTDPALLMGKGKESTDEALRRESWGAYTLYSRFPHKDSISGIEYINQVRRYIQAPV